MDFDISWLLWLVPLAFALGWMASRFDLRQMRVENHQAPKAYFKGLNHLLNEQQDQAIDAFIEAVRIDPDTSELHFALGNLFRRRGEYERAVRVHEHLLSRGDLTRPELDRAQYALALDYLKAGLLDRAEVSLSKLDASAFAAQAQMALLAIYERSRDWDHATAIAQKLSAGGHGDFSARLAHYLCEQAQDQGTQRSADATQLLLRAIDTAPQAARPRLDLATVQLRAGDAAQALKTLATLLEQAPASAPLAAPLIAQAAHAAGQQSSTLALLSDSYSANPCLDVLDAMIALDDPAGPARERYVRHLEVAPSLVAAARWLKLEKLEHEHYHPQVQRALERACAPLTQYRCAACGFEARQHQWQCPGCQTWDSYPARRVEEL